MNRPRANTSPHTRRPPEHPPPPIPLSSTTSSVAKSTQNHLDISRPPGKPLPSPASYASNVKPTTPVSVRSNVIPIPKKPPPPPPANLSPPASVQKSDNLNENAPSPSKLPPTSALSKPMKENRFTLLPDAGEVQPMRINKDGKQERAVPPLPLPPLERSKSLTTPKAKVGDRTKIFKIHLKIPELDVVKAISLDETMSVRRAIQIILDKVNIINNSIHYILVAPNYLSSEGFPLDEVEQLGFYSIQADDILTLRVRPSPLDGRTIVKLITLEGRVDSIQVDLRKNGSVLMEKISTKYDINVHLFLLTIEPEGRAVMGLSQLGQQGITTETTLRVTKKSKKELRQLRNSEAALKKKLGSVCPGVKLIVSKDFQGEVSSQLSVKRGDNITVLEEDHITGWWKGKIGDKVGFFPITAVKYYEERKPGEMDWRDIDQLRSAISSKLATTTKVMASYIRKKDVSPRSRISFERSSSTVPKLVEDTLAYLEVSKSYKEEGIFRISGNLVTIYKLKKMYQKGKPVDFFKLGDPHSVSGLLKLFLRELNEPLFTFELYEAFQAAIRIENDLMCTICLAEALSVLPPGNRAILARLFSFLDLVVRHQEHSKMTPANLAIVFAPSLFRPKVESMETMMSNEGRKLIEHIILHYERLFKEQAPSLGSQQQVAPEFNEVLQRGSILIEENLKKVQPPINEPSPKDLPNDSTSGVKQEEYDEDDEDDDEELIAVSDLVDCLLEGNVTGVEEYLEALPEDIKHNLKDEVYQTFRLLLEEKGIYSE